VVTAFRADPVAGAFPGAEPTEAAARRGAAALREVAAAEDGGRVLVVAHNTLIRVTLCELLGIPVRSYRTVFPRLENAAITEIGIDGGATGLHRFNLPTS
jgi:broad specificity phosphatase PhoE